MLIGPIDTWNQIGQFENKIFIDLLQKILSWLFYFRNKNMEESTFKQEDLSVEWPATRLPNEEVRIGPGGLGWIQGQYVGF